MFNLNSLKRPDIIFLVICIVVIVLIVAIYFLIPVFKHKQLKEQRENLRKRESAFRSNIKDEEENVVVEETKKENKNDEFAVDATIESNDQEATKEEVKE